MPGRLSLNSYLGWYHVLPLLGVEERPGALPMVVQCPLCHGNQMRIYDDIKFGGHWHYCASCQSSGDMIELASKAWKCSIHDAIAQLCAQGAPIPAGVANTRDIDEYIRLYPGRQKRFRTLAEDATDLMAKGDIDVRLILQRMGMPKDQQQAHWRQRMGLYMGGCSKVRAGQTVRPGCKTWDEMSSTIRKFKGPGWRDLIVIPFHDMPGRCAGAMFVGREARPHKDYDFFLIEAGGRGDDKKAEVGVCMYPVLDSRTAHKDKFDNHVFVFNDPVHALKLQARHMRDSDLPLPIVGTYHGLMRRQPLFCEMRTYELWATRRDKRFIFWGASVTPNLFNMASRADGKLWIAASATVLSRQPSHIWLQHMQKQAKHWTVVLESQLQSLQEEQAVSLLNSLDIPPEIMQQFARNCSSQVRELLERNKKSMPVMSNAVIGAKRITETANGWFVSGECVADAILRLDAVVCQPDNDTMPQYKGRIVLKDQEIPFVEDMAVLDKNPGVWLKKTVLNKAGKLAVVKRGWDQHLLDIARQFHEPTVISTDSRCGWNSSLARFSLPNFFINLGGQVTPEPALLVDVAAPGRDLFPPETPPVGIAQLGDATLQNKIFWAATACIGANILAPAIGQDVAGISLVGLGAFLCGKAAARKCGCYEHVSGGHRNGDQVTIAEEFDAINKQHQWPLIITLERNRSPRALLTPWFNGIYQRNAVLPLDARTAEAVGSVAPWRTIACGDNIQPGPETQLYGGYVLPLWLQRLCQRKLELSGEGPFVQQVLDDMANMMAVYGCNAENIRDAITAIDETAPAERLANLLYGIVLDGGLKIMQSGWEPPYHDSPHLIRIESEDRAPGIFLSQPMLATLLERNNLVALEPAGITRALQNANALDCQCRYNDEVGWLIVESWWSKQINRCKVRYQDRLKVIGGAA